MIYAYSDNFVRKAFAEVCAVLAGEGGVDGGAVALE
jgi:hypothetical protein